MSDDEPVRVPIEEAIDLHWFPPADLVSVVDEYLREAQRSGFDVVRVVHGRGKGFQRAAVQRLLSEHEAVDSFWDDTRAHLGATMVKLKKRLPSR